MNRLPGPVALCTVLSVFVIAGCSEPPPAEKEIVRPVRAMQVAGSSGLKGRKFSGRARAAQEVEVSFRVAGPLITLPVKVGDEVEAGQVIARIDPRDFEINLKNMQAQLAQGQAVVKRAEADLARLEGVRAKNPDFVSQLDYDNAVQNRDSARANVAALDASVRAAKDQLEDTFLKAPFDGIVVDTYVKNFEDVHARQPIVRIVDDSRIEFVVNIPENLISLVPQVRDVRVEFDAIPGEPVAAEVREIGTEASSTTRTYPVTLIMDQPEGAKILPGMVGRAYGAPPEGAMPRGIEVPVSAVFAGEDSDQSFVWIIDEDSKTVSRRAVVTEDLTERGIRVTEGLEAGEWIATAGAHYLREGQPVRLLEIQTD
jgi:RND family efflux transporter MFP subunit